MAAIVETTYFDKKIQLGNEEVGRALNFGVNWTKLRIAVRLCINGKANIGTGSFADPPQLVAGVSQGTAAMFRSQTTTDFFGGVVMTAAFTSGVYTFTQDTPPYYSTGVGINAIRRQTASNSTSSNGATAGLIVNGTAGGSNRSMLLWDITKGSASYSCQIWGPSSATNAKTDLSKNAFTAAFSNEATPTNMTSLGTASVSFTPTGLYDSVCLSWNRWAPTVEISDLTVIRFA